MLRIHTDGSSLNKRKLGAYAYVIHDSTDTTLFMGSGYDTQTTNNRMEMTGVIEALKCLNNAGYVGPIEVISDSQYVIYSITKKWSKQKNVDLWKILHAEHMKFIASGGKIKYSWIKGHTGDVFNEMVDEMAGIKLKELERYIKEGIVVEEMCGDAPKCIDMQRDA